MGGTILIADQRMLATNTVDFDYLVETVRGAFPAGHEQGLALICEPLDVGGMNFISLIGATPEAFNAFNWAARQACGTAVREASFPARAHLWHELLAMLDTDPGGPLKGT